MSLHGKYILSPGQVEREVVALLFCPLSLLRTAIGHETPLRNSVPAFVALHGFPHIMLGFEVHFRPDSALKVLILEVFPIRIVDNIHELGGLRSSVLIHIRSRFLVCLIV